MSKSGKKIPLDPFDHSPHCCQASFDAWSLEHPLICRQCGEAELYFDDNIVSASGKRIPLEVETGTPHDCPKSQYRNNYRRGR